MTTNLQATPSPLGMVVHAMIFFSPDLLKIGITLLWVSASNMVLCTDQYSAVFVDKNDDYLLGPLVDVS